jgi:hypothetical protein
MVELSLEIQWKLLEGKVSREILDRIKKDMNPPFIDDHIKTIRAENERLYFLGERDTDLVHFEYDCKNGGKITWGFPNKKPYWYDSDGKARVRQYHELQERLKKDNFEDLRLATLPIGIYPESLERVNEKMRVSFRKVDTKTALSYIVENGEFWLKARAWVLGADAIVDFSEKEFDLYLGYLRGNDGALRHTTETRKYSIGVPVTIRGESA